MLSELDEAVDENRYNRYNPDAFTIVASTGFVRICLGLLEDIRDGRIDPNDAADSARELVYWWDMTCR